MVLASVLWPVFLGEARRGVRKGAAVESVPLTSGGASPHTKRILAFEDGCYAHHMAPKNKSVL